MRKNGHVFRAPFRRLSFTIILGILFAGCGPSTKTGTVLDGGTVTGVEMAEDGQLGRLIVQLAVKLDDGTEVTATWKEKQGQGESLKGRRVELEPGKGSKSWTVIRILGRESEPSKAR